jgi:hypothetical protein
LHDADIFFHCQHCKTALVANRAATGMNLACQKRGEQTLVPKPETRNVSAIPTRTKFSAAEGNRIAAAAVTGYINQVTIQLRRWQLRLQTLNERKARLDKELGVK